MEDFLKDSITTASGNYDYITAVFLCERLHAQTPCSENRRLLAQIYFESGKANRAYSILEKSCLNSSNLAPPENRFLFARCSFDLSKVQEAESALLGGRTGSEKNIPNGAAGYQLLGLICKHTERPQEAVQHFKKSLELDPHLWSSVQHLCDMGEQIDLESAFVTHLEQKSVEQKSVDQKPDFQYSPIPLFNPPELSKSPLLETTRANTDLHSFSTPQTTPVRQPTLSNPPAVVHKKRKMRIPSSDQNAKSQVQIFDDPQKTNSAPRRRKSRFVTHLTSPPEIVLSASQPMPRMSSSSRHEKKRMKPPSSEPLKRYTHLMRTMAEGYQQLQAYNCAEAIKTFQSLPVKQYNTGWVLCQIGKAYHRMDKNAQAITVFEAMRKIAPDRMSGLEVFSTALWQLQKEVELSHLAQVASEFDRSCHETWIIVGNCFSLQKEHGTAIKFFKRALQAKPDDAYAYTLLAHEYVMNEDFDKAMSGFRNAIRYDPRHYVAWYGLGNIYNRQEKFKLAAHHLLKAYKINRQSSVLCRHIGQILRNQDKFTEALEWFDRAVSVNENDFYARYQKGLVYADLRDFEKALEELQAVSALAPLEASVHHEMGKIYRDMNDYPKALSCFDTALGLDPKDKHAIKTDLEKLGAPKSDQGDARYMSDLIPHL